jgi:hypothetical protein
VHRVKSVRERSVIPLGGDDARLRPPFSWNLFPGRGLGMARIGPLVPSCRVCTLVVIGQRRADQGGPPSGRRPPGISHLLYCVGECCGRPSAECSRKSLDLARPCAPSYRTWSLLFQLRKSGVALSGLRSGKCGKLVPKSIANCLRNFVVDRARLIRKVASHMELPEK